LALIFKSLKLKFTITTILVRQSLWYRLLYRCGATCHVVLRLLRMVIRIVCLCWACMLNCRCKWRPLRDFLTLWCHFLILSLWASKAEYLYQISCRKGHLSPLPRCLTSASGAECRKRLWGIRSRCHISKGNWNCTTVLLIGKLSLKLPCHPHRFLASRLRSLNHPNS